MNYYEFSENINATPQAVWDVITNKELILANDLGLTKLEGDIRAGGKLKLWAEVSGDRAFVIKVTNMEAPTHMIWQSGMPFGLFTGTRHFRISQSGDKTRLHVREDYTGLMSGMIFKSIPDLEPSMKKFVLGVKKLAEGAPS